MDAILQVSLLFFNSTISISKKRMLGELRSIPMIPIPIMNLFFGLKVRLVEVGVA